MTEKQCVKCGTIHPLEFFQKNKPSKNGRSNVCYECLRKYNQQYRKDKKYIRTDDKKIKSKRNMKRKEESPEKVHANKCIELLIKSGKLLNPGTCSLCGYTKNVVAHHEDYDKPLEIIWVCQFCHMKIHFGKTKESFQIRDFVKGQGGTA